MGCDIHMFAEKQKPGGGFEHIRGVPGFSRYRQYGVFAFLAGVRNYSDIIPIAEPRGLPKDVSSEVRAEWDSWYLDQHTPSWLSVRELATFDYDVEIEDRRSRGNDGSVTVPIGDGENMTLRAFLTSYYFEVLDEIMRSGADRIVFWFDN